LREFIEKNKIAQISIDILEIKDNLVEVVSGTMKTIATNTAAGEQAESWLDIVRRQVGSLDFGVVQIVVHGTRVVQIERTEKIRLEAPLRAQTEGTNFARQTSGGTHSNNA